MEHKSPKIDSHIWSIDFCQRCKAIVFSTTDAEIEIHLPKKYFLKNFYLYLFHTINFQN